MPKLIQAGCCKNPRLRMLRPIPASVEQEESVGYFIASFARGDCDDFGTGASELAAVEDLVVSAAATYLMLRDQPSDKLSPHLLKEKSVLSEFFELTHQEQKRRDILRDQKQHEQSVERQKAILRRPKQLKKK